MPAIESMSDWRRQQNKIRRFRFRWKLVKFAPGGIVRYPVEAHDEDMRGKHMRLFWAAFRRLREALETRGINASRRVVLALMREAGGTGMRGANWVNMRCWTLNDGCRGVYLDADHLSLARRIARRRRRRKLPSQ